MKKANSARVGWVKRSVTHRNYEHVNEHDDESMGYGAMRLHPSYALS